MLNKEELKQVKVKIEKTIRAIEDEHYNHIMKEMGPDRSIDDEYPGWSQAWQKMRIKDVYYLILAYIEARQMPQLLLSFKANFDSIINNEKVILNSTLTDPEGEHELDTIIGFRRFLEPFRFFDYSIKDENEIHRLISILGETEFIVKNAGVTIVGEADIYNTVRWVLSLYYPRTRKARSATFSGVFKDYRPDILVPELKVAIEYKYIDKKHKNIDEYIDQLIVDAINYKGDAKYNEFIAVIYINDGAVATTKSIQLAWDSKKFPKNWKLVLCTNSKITKRSK